MAVAAQPCAVTESLRLGDQYRGWRGPLRRILATKARKLIVALTLLLGMVVGFGLAGEAESFGVLARPVQSIMSILVPFVAVLLVRESPKPLRAIAASTFCAAAVGLFGGVLCVVVSALAGLSWGNVVIAVVGGILVQVLAVLVGTAAGLLLRRPVIACLATVVVPLGLWAALRPIGLHEWLTPAGNLPYLLTGELSARAWVRWLVVVALWGVALNVAGLRWRRPRGHAVSGWVWQR